MSRADVEIVRGLFTGVATTDKQVLLEALPQIIAQACDPQIEWVEDPARADATIHRGHAGVRKSWEEWLTGFDAYSFEIDDVIDCGDDVLVIGTEHGRGTASGAAVSSHNYALLTLHDGKILRYREFNDERAARHAAGLAS
jgi:ketosteroid isomerase-like protein